MFAFARIFATVKFQTVYQCVDCPNTESGGTAQTVIDAPDLSNFTAQMSRLRQSPHAMPLGWSSNPEGFRCDVCTRKRDPHLLRR